MTFSINNFKQHKKQLISFFEAKEISENYFEVESELATGFIFFKEIKTIGYFVHLNLKLKRKIDFNLSYNQLENFQRVASFFNNSIHLDALDNKIKKRLELDGFVSASKNIEISGDLNSGDQLRHVTFIHNMNLFDFFEQEEKRKLFKKNKDVILYLDKRLDLSAVENRLNNLYQYPLKIRIQLLHLKLEELQYIYLNRLFKLEHLSTQVETKYQKTLFEIKQSINDNIKIKPNIKAIAKHWGINETSLQKYFKGLFGMSIYQYYTTTRIERAKEALIDQGEQISYVCYEFGYTDIQHFSKQFKSIYGISPSNYLNQYKTGS